MNKVSLKPKKILYALLLFCAAQLLVYILIAYLKPESLHNGGFWSLFNMDEEVSIPTWYSQFLFLLPALLSGWLALIAAKKDKVYWAVLSGIMVYLSIDDGAGIHERFWIISRIIGQYIPISGDVFYYPWVAIGLILVLVVVAVFARFFFRLPNRIRWLVALSAILFIGGAIGVEMYTAYMIATTGADVSAVVIGIEETLEILGISIFTYALLSHIKHLPESNRSIKIEVI